MTRTPEPGAAQASILNRTADRILDLPRLGRLVMVVLFALATALLLTPLVDSLYLRYVFPWASADVSDLTRLIPSLLTATAGVLMFLFGWGLVVGKAGTRPRRRPGVIVYFFVGVFVLLLALSQILVALVGLTPMLGV